MEIIGFILISVLLFIIFCLFILFVPFYFSLFFNKKGREIETEFKVSWFFGLIKRKFIIDAEKTKKKSEDAEKLKKKAEGKSKKAGEEEESIVSKLRKISYSIRDAYGYRTYAPAFLELFYPFLKFSKDALFSMKIREMKIRAKIGFPEPQYTGLFMGLWYFFMGLSFFHKMNSDIVVEPDFNVPYDSDEVKLDLTINTVFEVRLINFAVPVARFILTKPSRKLMWGFITGKIKFKK
jgi:hypothetical protein